MKYMLMMNTPATAPYQITSWPQEGHRGATSQFMMAFAKKLRRGGRAGRRPRAGRPRPGQARARRQGRQADHRRRVPGVEGVPRRLLDRRRRQPGARLRDRRRGVGRARAGRQAAEHGDRGAPGDERAAARRARDARRRWTRRDAEHLLRELAPQVLGAIVRRYRDFAACEDAVQEALIAAATQWPRDGMPDNPRGWLIHVASRRITDHVRAETARRHREALVVSLVPPDEQIALAADTDGATRARRHARPAVHVLPPGAVARVRDRADAARGRRPDDGRDRQGVPGARGDDGAADQPRQADASRRRACRSRCRRGDERAARLGAVLHVLYLIFNEGYAASSGTELHRDRSVGRGDPADALLRTAGARRRARSRGCWR